MTDLDTSQTKIAAYTIDALSEELDALARLPVDPYTKFVYDRARELHWTSERALRRFGRFLRARLGAVPVKGATIDGPIPPPPERGRLFVDMTNTVETGAKTGIQRVVREIAREMVLSGAGLPVVIERGALVPHYRHPSLPQTVTPGPGDILLLLDAAWNNLGDYPRVLQTVKASGGKVVAAVYDILPLLYPALFRLAVAKTFAAWRETIVLQSDAVVAISRATAESVAAYERDAGNENPPPIGWWPLGADFGAAAPGDSSPKAKRIAAGGAYLLSVGTLEPRKGYPVALDAFERLWTEGRDISYVIVGKAGWNASALRARIRGHKEYDRRLFWFERARDADLRALYAGARAVVSASVAEGFGLPLVEAALHGAPVIASDIPVFREVAGDGARFFRLLDPGSLAAAIDAELDVPKIAPRIGTISWRQSAETLARLIREDAYQL